MENMIFDSECLENDRKVILETIAKHGTYEFYGLASYGNDYLMADYCLFVDKTTEETEVSGVFYRLVCMRNNRLHYYDNSVYYPYTVDLKDEQWKGKLKEAAKCAYEYLFDTKKDVLTIYGEKMTDKQFHEYVVEECKRQWKDNQEDTYGEWDKQPFKMQDTYYIDMYRMLRDE